jgi:uncharacterized protein YraI
MTIADGNLMRIRYIGIRIVKPVVALGLFLCWVSGAIAADKWDTETTARVNLRKLPSPNGIILSIVPKGHKVKILEKKGLWRKVDVEGDIHGKGWVYADYLEKISTKLLFAETNSQTATVELVAEEPIVGTAPADTSANIRTQDDMLKPSDSPPTENTDRVEAKVRSLQKNETPSSADESVNPLEAKKPVIDESLQSILSDASPQLRMTDEKEKTLTGTKSHNVLVTGQKQHATTREELQAVQNESDALKRMQISNYGKPIHRDPLQSPPSGISSQTGEVVEKDFSAVSPEEPSFPRVKDIAGQKKQSATPEEQGSLRINKRTTTSRPGIEETAKHRIAVSLDEKRTTSGRKSMGLIELALKLTAIVLTGLVVVFLHRANKIASIQYNALVQSQHSLKTSRPKNE